jgi:DNA-binding winged helix-turn-helix (wHTH) protein/TolB-like protein
LLFSFGPFRLERESYRLLRDDAPVSMSPKAIDLLFLFASRPSTLITKDDILQALWPGIAVTDNAITQVVSDLRQALGDSPASPRYIQTVPRRGYRFIARVVHDEAARGPEAGRARAATDAAAPVARAPTAPAAAAAGSPDAGAARAPGSAGARGPVRTIAVLDFTNVTGDADVAWLSAGIAETVTNDLRSIRDVIVLDRALLTEASTRAAAASDRPAGPDLLVVGSFQRSADRLRITARAVDVVTRGALAHARVDGALADVFQLQDALVTQLSAALRLTITPAAAARMRARETTSLDAYRAATEGRVKLESMDPAQVAPAAADFERAIALDPRYALAHVGLAHARFWQYQATRAAARPDLDALRDAIAHARRAVEIDADLAEAHSALAFFLASAERPQEAVAAGRLAVALEPDNWRHQFRLGMAAWGTERLAALELVLQRYPQLAYAYFGIAMVHVARGDFGPAEIVLRQGLAWEHDAAGTERFPGSGLHWLLGMVKLAIGDLDAARQQFDREIAAPARGLLANEFAMDACNGLGFVRLQAGDRAGAAAMFRKALERYPDHARSWLGLAQASLADGCIDEAEAAMTRASRAIEELKKNGRATEAQMTLAFSEVVAGFPSAAVSTLSRMLDDAASGSAGWTLPIEPWLAPLRGDERIKSLLARVSGRAE